MIFWTDFLFSSVQLLHRAAGGGEFLFDLLFISEPIYCVKYEQYPSSIRSRGRFCSEFPYMAWNCFLLFSVAAATATATTASFKGLLNYFIGSNRKFQIHDFLFYSE